MPDFDHDFPSAPPSPPRKGTRGWPSFEALHEEVELLIAKRAAEEWPPPVLRPGSGRSRLG